MRTANIGTAQAIIDSRTPDTSRMESTRSTNDTAVRVALCNDNKYVHPPAPEKTSCAGTTITTIPGRFSNSLARLCLLPSCIGEALRSNRPGRSTRAVCADCTCATASVTGPVHVQVANRADIRDAKHGKSAAQNRFRTPKRRILPR